MAAFILDFNSNFKFQYETIVSEMQSIYSMAKICSFHNSSKCDLGLEPGKHLN